YLSIAVSIVIVNQQTETNVTVKEGEDIKINCSNSAQGEGQWKNEDGTDIKLSSRIRIEGNNILVITNSSQDDAGVYKCLRGNSINIVNLRVKVTVKVKISLRILNWNFTNEIKDKTTSDYKKFEDNFKAQMAVVYKNLEGYAGVEILEIRNGSIRVIFRVIVVQVVNKKGETTIKRIVVAQKIVDQTKTGWINDNLQVDTSPEAFETDSPPPQPENVTLIEATDDGAEIAWDKPQNHIYYGIKGYLIEYWVFSQPKNKENTGIIKGQRSKITGLKDGTAYVARVVGMNQERGQESDNIDIRTKEAVLAGWIIALIVIFSILFLLIIIAVIIFLCRRRRVQKEKEKQEMFAMSSIRQEKINEVEKGQPHLKSFTNKTYDMSDGSWIDFPRESLVLQDVLGSGEFGVVHRGKLMQDGKTIECAVKTLKGDAGPEQYRALYEELEIMANIGNHPNLVNLIGATAEEDKLYVIVEFARHGSLIEYLRSQRLKPEKEYEFELKYVNRLRIALDVAKGMAFLQSKRCVHRDLAARNVLLADDFVAKVADFGLSRDIYETGEYEKTTGGKVPTRWMAIESLEIRKFTLKSDIWSFGVLLWEIETKGLMPHGAVSYIELVDRLKRGHRLEQPNGTPDELYALMQKCWAADPSDRPNFLDVRDTLETLLSDADDYLEENPYVA
ncbi:angiopoietin-1 receptor-like, partial [Actinia tenebrosa]|uniref:receptor protein-tyrosine kinase n=1 Tax=Actinia tenebrosa TaxID=6105 RepID=A0A6P8IU69_ACTTE